MLGCSDLASRALEIRTERSESRQQSRRRSRPRWRHWRRSWNDTDRRRRSLMNPHSKRERCADEGSIQNGNQSLWFSAEYPATKTLKAELDQAKAASDESVPLSKRIRARERPQSGQRSGAGGRAEHCGCSEEPGTAPSQGCEDLEVAARATEPPGAAPQTSCSRSVAWSRGHTAANHVPRRNHQ